MIPVSLNSKPLSLVLRHSVENAQISRPKPKPLPRPVSKCPSSKFNELIELLISYKQAPKKQVCRHSYDDIS